MNRTRLGKIAVVLWTIQLVFVILLGFFMAGQLAEGAKEYTTEMEGPLILFVIFFLLIMAIPIVIPLLAMWRNKKKLLRAMALTLVIINFMFAMLWIGSMPMYMLRGEQSNLGIVSNFFFSNTMVYLILFLTSIWPDYAISRYLWIVVLICRAQFYIVGLFNQDSFEALDFVRVIVYGALTTTTITLLSMWISRNELFYENEYITKYLEQYEVSGLEEQLMELKSLQKAGLITEEDYERKKNQLLNI